MFEQSLLEKSSETTARKRWTTVASYSTEALAILIALAFPLLHTEAFPFDDATKFRPPTRYAPPHVQVVETQRIPRAARTQPVMINPYLAPTRIAKHTDTSPDPTPPSTLAGGPTIPGALPGDGGPTNPVLESVLRHAIEPPLRHAGAPLLRTSRLQENLLIRQVKPAYPTIAKQARIQGAVVLQAVIGKDGAIQQLRVVSGHPLLTKAALDAVQQWRYRPYLLNGEAVEVETQVTVNFLLNGN